MNTNQNKIETETEICLQSSMMPLNPSLCVFLCNLNWKKNYISIFLWQFQVQSSQLLFFIAHLKITELTQSALQIKQTNLKIKINIKHNTIN